MKKITILLTLVIMPFIMMAQKQDKPNILVIWGDDIGWSNPSIYNRGMMGYKTPNIDKIGNDGILFTDYYSQQSCTAGRAAFITGQSPYRTGLTKVGLPGAKEGLSGLDPTIAELLKNHGYMTGQFGKNHLGDRDEHLPTNHGFDEFLGNLYHLNAEEEPENADYPQDPEFRKKFGPRGVISSSSDGRIEDTGPLTKKRMETVDQETKEAAIAFMKKSHADGKPFFTWYNSTLMHVWTHLTDDEEEKTGLGVYADGMVKLDKIVGELTNTLKELGIEENTIVIFGTDNGAEIIFWPDGGMTPFRGEKATTWEGGFRAPAVIRWPGVIKPGTINNGIHSHEDMMPTLLAAAGVPDVKEKLLTGYTSAGKTFKAHLDGYNMMDSWKNGTESPRKEIFYFDAGGNLNALRYQDWKIHFALMEGAINEGYRKTPSWPVVINLRADPFEVSWKSSMYTRWYGDNMWLFVPAQQFVGEFLQTFKDFPPVAGGSLGVDKLVETLGKRPQN